MGTAIFGFGYDPQWIEVCHPRRWPPSLVLETTIAVGEDLL
jgi:hypothetical protein